MASQERSRPYNDATRDEVDQMAVELRTLDDHDPLLDSSKLLNAVQKAVGFAQDNDGIGLTKGKAFNRKFVAWAAENFDWPEYSRAFRIDTDEELSPFVIH